MKFIMIYEKGTKPKIEEEFRGPDQLQCLAFVFTMKIWRQNKVGYIAHNWMTRKRDENRKSVRWRLRWSYDRNIILDQSWGRNLEKLVHKHTRDLFLVLFWYFETKIFRLPIPKRLPLWCPVDFVDLPPKSQIGFLQQLPGTLTIVHWGGIS